jgi:hypothetical protein
MHPRPSVHPLVGPLFSAPQHHGGPLFETDVAERPGSYDREGVEQMTAQNTKAVGPSTYFEEMAGPQVPQIVSMPHLSHPAAGFLKHSGANQNSRPGQLMPVESVTEMSRPESFGSVERERADEFRTPEKTEFLRSGKTKEEGRSEYSLLLPPTAVSHRTEAQSGPSSAPVAPVTQRSQGRRTTAASKGEPDDIQIHIGKIEVLAVPQTPAPAPAKTSRKATSLDQYLQQRDRSRS